MPWLSAVSSEGVRGRWSSEMDKWVGTASAVMWAIRSRLPITIATKKGTTELILHILHTVTCPPHRLSLNHSPLEPDFSNAEATSRVLKGARTSAPFHTPVCVTMEDPISLPSGVKSIWRVLLSRRHLKVKPLPNRNKWCDPGFLLSIWSEVTAEPPSPSCP